MNGRPTVHLEIAIWLTQPTPSNILAGLLLEYVANRLGKFMANLIGYAYQNGTIEFDRNDNPWAFRRLDGELKEGQENRIRFDPSVAPVVIQPSPNVKADTLTWLNDAQEVIQSASVVYLQRTEKSLRFRLAIHTLSPEKSLITIGSNAEFQHFAASRLNKIQSIYAKRSAGFQFDIEKMLVRDRDLTRTFPGLELSCRMRPRTADGIECLGFDATGANAHAELVQWRAEVADGQVGKLSLNEERVRISVSNYLHPITLCEELHPETKCRWFLFSPESVKAWLERARKKKRA